MDIVLSKLSADFCNLSLPALGVESLKQQQLKTPSVVFSFWNLDGNTQTTILFSQKFGFAYFLVAGLIE